MNYKEDAILHDSRHFMEPVEGNNLLTMPLFQYYAGQYVGRQGLRQAFCKRRVFILYNVVYSIENALFCLQAGT
jgi:hypothetical protein